MELEKWADIWGYYGRYQVSNLGRVKSLKRKVKCKNGAYRSVKEKILLLHLNENGYVVVPLCKNGREKLVRVSRLVGKYFIPNPFKKPEVNHIKGNKLDNRSYMLEWVTRRENIKHAWEFGLNKGRTKKVA